MPVSFRINPVSHAGNIQAYEGDHAALVECIVQGMQETVASVKAL